MTILVNNVLRIGTLPDIIYIAKPNTVFPRRMSHTQASVQDNARIAASIDRVLQQPGYVHRHQRRRQGQSARRRRANPGQDEHR